MPKVTAIELLISSYLISLIIGAFIVFIVLASRNKEEPPILSDSDNVIGLTHLPAIKFVNTTFKTSAGTTDTSVGTELVMRSRNRNLTGSSTSPVTTMTSTLESTSTASTIQSSGSPPDINADIAGRLRLLAFGEKYCVEAAAVRYSIPVPLNCTPMVKNNVNQYWNYNATEGYVMQKNARGTEFCITLTGPEAKEAFQLIPCVRKDGPRNPAQLWNYNRENYLINSRDPDNNHTCVAVSRTRDQLAITDCDENDELQQWTFDGFGNLPFNPTEVSAYFFLALAEYPDYVIVQN